MPSSTEFKAGLGRIRVLEGYPASTGAVIGQHWRRRGLEHESVTSTRVVQAWPNRRSRHTTPGRRLQPRPVALRRGRRGEAGGLAQHVCLVDPLPREVVVVAAEMAVGSRLRVDRTAQVEVAQDRGRAEV